MFQEFFAQIHHFMYFILYIRMQNSFQKPLSAPQEAKFLERLKNGDSEARDVLINHNLRLVAHVVKKYYATESEQDDLLSIGTIGLIKAVDSYNFDKGARFSTYAARCIENEILMHFRSQRKSAQDISINDVIDTDKEGNELTLIDVIASEDTIVDAIDKKFKIEHMLKGINTVLDDREKKIIILRYGLNNCYPKSQQDTADLLGISRSYVSRIEKKALEKLRKRFQEAPHS